MAVAVEFASVVLRKSAIERHVPGGVDALVLLPLPNFAEDEHLLRVGFMSTSEAVALMSEVEALASPPFNLEENVALLQWNSQPYPAWLSVGVVDGHGACRLAGTDPGAVVRPDHSRILFCFGATEHDVLEWLSAATRPSNAARDANGDVRVTCTRDDALVDVQLLRGDDRVVAILDRRLSRRGQRVADLRLTLDLVEVLRKRGSRDLG